MNADQFIPERFFYHSFPRRRDSITEEIDRGCNILTAIRDFGMLLTPQFIEWNQPSFGGAPSRVFPILQKRVCFTELQPSELPQHAEKFGRFALEFKIDTVRSLGAVPVFYVPQPTGDATDGSAIGTALLAIAMDSQVVIQRMAQLDQMFKGATPVAENFGYKPSFARSPEGSGDYTLNRDEAKNFLAAIGHAVTPWNDLSAGAFALLNFFHPTDNVKIDKAMEYYREREWRVACGFRLKNPDGSHVDVLRLPTPSEREKLLEIDREFFGRKITTDTGIIDTLDQVLVHPGLHGKKLIEMIQRVIVPMEAMDRTAKILADVVNAPPIISIEELLVK